MKVFNLLRNLWQRAKSYSDSNLQTAKDYADSITEAQTELYIASWTATTSNAVGAALTNNLTVPSGYYIVILKVPNITSSQFSVGVTLNGTTTNRSITVATSHGLTVFAVKLTASTVLRGIAQQSAKETFTLLERGGLYAMKIAEVGGGTN